MPGDPPGETPDSSSLPEVDRHVLPAGLPLVVPRDTQQVIGEALPRLRHQLVAILQRRMAAQVIQRDQEGLLHLGGAFLHALQTRPVHHPQNGIEDKVGPVGNKIQPPQQADVILGNGQLFPGLPQGAGLRALHPLYLSSGEAHLPRLAMEFGGPHLVEDLPPLFTLHQRDQHGVAPGGIHQAGGAHLQQLVQLFQLHQATPRLAASRLNTSSRLITAPTK